MPRRFTILQCALLLVSAIFTSALDAQEAAESSPPALVTVPETAEVSRAIDAVEKQLDRIGQRLEAIDDKEAASRKERHEASDLAAQWKQSLWAMLMFIAAAVQTVLTAAGLALIFFTLRATRDAARHAESMVAEAARGTAAALAAVDVTRDVGHAQVRAYLVISDASLTFLGKKPEIRFKVVNHGQTPARDLQIETTFGVAPLNDPLSWGISLSTFPYDLGSGQAYDTELTTDQEVPQEVLTWGKAEACRCVCIGQVTFTDVFGARIQEPFHFHQLLPPNHSVLKGGQMIRPPRFHEIAA